MSITGALNNALSGLRVSGRASQVVSNNIANALTPGYAKRSIELASNSTGAQGGVRVASVVRFSDPVLLADRRAAGSDVAYHTTTNRFLSDFEAQIGTPNQPFSLSGRLSTVNADLITAISRPDAVERLDTAVASADDLAVTLQDASKSVQTARSQADASISVEVARLNDALAGVEDLNEKIQTAQISGITSSGLIDERQALIDEISEIVPVRSLDRANGAVALYSARGAVLIDGRASEIAFEAANVVTPHMNVEDGTLGGLTINGLAQRTSSQDGQLSGGSLGAHFAVRDEFGVQAQEQLDAFARDLITRFENITADTTRAPGAPGLFTDSGASFDPANETGLSQRIEVFAGINPNQGGETWRLRDGLFATDTGLVGDSTILQALADAMSDPAVPASGDFGASAMTSDGLLSAMSAQIGSTRMRSDQQLSFASAQFSEFYQMELAQGVDTDAEMQQLLLIEQSYAANARMIETIEQLMDTLLRI